VTAGTVYTVGYGGRAPADFLELLAPTPVRTVVDVRLRPDRASMGAWTRARTPDKGIEKLLSAAGLGYVSLVELGNPFVGLADWPERYRRLLAAAGDLLTERLAGVPGPVCLLCAEKRAAGCHRAMIAAHLAAGGAAVVHLE
jgi:uncharacterized protein (DUF488 family)